MYLTRTDWLSVDEVDEWKEAIEQVTDKYGLRVDVETSDFREGLRFRINLSAANMEGVRRWKECDGGREVVGLMVKIYDRAAGV